MKSQEFIKKPIDRLKQRFPPLNIKTGKTMNDNYSTGFPTLQKKQKIVRNPPMLNNSEIQKIKNLNMWRMKNTRKLTPVPNRLDSFCQTINAINNTQKTDEYNDEYSEYSVILCHL